MIHSPNPQSPKPSLEGDTLTKEERHRYARHFILPEFGEAGQQRLKASKVLVVGAGGLGSPVLQYLAAAGVGTIGIIDDDTVDLSNLQRQVLYTVNDLGRPKAVVAKESVLAINPHINVHIYQERLTIDNVLDIIADYDIVADGTDNFPTRYLVNDACVLAGKVNVYASIFRFEGQVSVFNLPKADGSRGINYRDLFPEPPDPDSVPSCAEGGVLGVLPGIIGSMQANEVIKVAAGVGEPLAGRLFLFDAASFSTRVLKIPRNPNVEIKSLEALQEYCRIPTNDFSSMSAVDFLAWRDNHQHTLIDVREPKEFAAQNMGGKLIPLSQLKERTDEIPKDHPVVIHCKSGARSKRAIQLLMDNWGYQNLINLEGGIDAWSLL
ncbi:MAG: molybdopterin-synthase adenylyltransferase MoeB [Bacteroidota bacterium]